MSNLKNPLRPHELKSLIHWHRTSFSYLHCTPGFSLHSYVQQESSLRWRRPGSHSSPSSTLELPHTLLFLSVKHSGALKRSVLPTELLLQEEKCFEGERKERVRVESAAKKKNNTGHE